MKRPSVLIVGAGLGGCVLAHALADSHEVTVVERAEGEPGPTVRDVGRPALTEPHHAVGLGGSTRLWHNGLIEIDPDVFEAHWPFPKSELEAHYRQAFALLSGHDLSAVRQATEQLRRRHAQAGVSWPAHSGLYYPQWPRNVWDSLALQGRVRLVRGEATALVHDDTPGASNDRLPSGLRVAGVTLRQADGQEQLLRADRVVLAAGGLGTPCVLQAWSTAVRLPALAHAGAHYEDHPMGFVGELELDAPLYRLWNFKPAGLDGNLRLPLVVRHEGGHVSFQLRPSARVAGSGRRQRVDTVLNELRRRWWSPPLWGQVLRNRDDLLDILSFKFNLHLPTAHYTLLMVAQMTPGPHRSVWRETSEPNRGAPMCRDWRLTAQDLKRFEAALHRALETLRPITRSARLFEGWREQLRSAAHHCGTARLSRSPATGVCDEHGRVHGTANLHVCDGSLIPASGVANTGLTIAALALRLAAHLQSAPHCPHRTRADREEGVAA